METIVVKNYINIEKVKEVIHELYLNAVDGYEDFEKDYIFDNYNLEDMAYEMAWSINDDMNKYLHQKDHKMYGNFNNIDYDYVHFRTGEFNYDYDMVNEMIARLDNQEDSEQANADRDFLSDWIFDTIGTFGIEYNFTSAINDELYVVFEMEEETL